MFKKANRQKHETPSRPVRKLTRAEKKEIKAAITKAKQADRKGISAQQTIPYKRMYPDGVCQVTDRLFSKTIEFLDITYQLAQNEDKTAIFDGWCDFLNFFDPSIHFQFVFVDVSASEERIAATIDIPPVGDDFDSARSEYTQMLRNQGAKGKNGLRRAKYLTFGVEENSLSEAKSRLERLEIDLINNYRKLGVNAAGLNGKAHLEVMHDILNMDSQSPFRFSWDWLPLSGLSTKDYIAPSSFEFKTGRMFRMGKKYCKVSFLQILAPELQDRILADLPAASMKRIVSMTLIWRIYSGRRNACGTPRRHV